MRLTRPRAAFVAMVAILHLGAGVMAAFAPCCAETASGMMECCLTGGPDHVCPHMMKRAPAGDRTPSPAEALTQSCSTGHDAGIPMLGFAGVPPDGPVAFAPQLIAVGVERFDQAPARRFVSPPTPPPQI